MFGLELGTVKWIAIGIAVAAVLGYIGVLKMEVAHYKSDRDSIQAEFKTYKTNNEAMHTAFKSSNAALTLKLKEQGIKELEQLAKNKKDNDAKIKAEHLNAALNARLVRVLNDLAVPDSQGSGTTTTEPGHASGTNPTISDSQTLTEEDLALTISENNTNHWACIDMVHKWQNFWKDFVSNTQKAQGG